MLAKRGKDVIQFSSKIVFARKVFPNANSDSTLSSNTEKLKKLLNHVC